MAGAAALCGAALAQPADFDWDVLRPPQVRLADPFAELPSAHLTRLIQVVRIDQAIAATDGRDAALDAVRQRVLAATRQRLIDEMKADAVPVDELLAARLTIIDHRRAQAETTVTGIDGREVSLGGYLLPVGQPPGAAATEVYLVPEPVACAHDPLPAVNQVVRVTLAALAGTIDPLRPVRLAGRLEAVRSARSLWLSDGRVEVIAGYRMHDARMVPDEPAGGH